METNAGCIEKDCTFDFQGKTFESGGSFLLPCSDGKWRGVVYGDWKIDKWETSSIVTNWHGDIKANAHYGKVFTGNMGDKRRHVWFTWKGINYHGLWSGIDYNQSIRVTSIK